MASTFPRIVLPSQVEVGDTISVELPKTRGIITTVRGKVAFRRDSPSTRHLVTREGAVLLAWDAKENRSVTVTLLRREPASQTPMFDV